MEQVKVKVIVTLPNGEVLDSFVVQAQERDTPALRLLPIPLSQAVREHIESRFEVED
jgi:hypothetical protein